MTRESYEKITGILRGHPRRIRLVCLFNHTLTGFIFVLRPGVSAAAFSRGQHFFPEGAFRSRRLLCRSHSLPSDL